MTTDEAERIIDDWRSNLRALIAATPQVGDRIRLADWAKVAWLDADDLVDIDEVQS